MREARARAWLSRLLCLYPRGFREAVGDDLIETTLHRWRDMKEGGAGEVRFWTSEGAHFAVDGAIERMRSLRNVPAELGAAWLRVKRTPTHHALAVGTLALGIGATTTIFAIADAVVLRPLPYPGPDRLYRLEADFGSLQLSSNSLPNLRDIQAMSRSMAWLAGAQDRSPALTDGFGSPERVSAQQVTEAYLPGLGASVQRGRGFTAADYAVGAARVAIVSEALWRRRWNSSDAVIGSVIEIDGVAHTVTGVMSGGFRDPAPIESDVATAVWLPVRAVPVRDRDDYGFAVIGSLRDGVTLESARAELLSIGQRLSAAHPQENRLYGSDMKLVPASLQDITIGGARPRLLLLLGAVLLLLLLSCANVANLFLARGVTRGAELATRAMLGATPARLATQLMLESVVTALLAAMVGGALAVMGVRAFLAAAPADIPRLHEVALDARVFGAVTLLTAVTALLFGTLPALHGVRSAKAASTSMRISASRNVHRLQGVLVAVEVALSLVLVTSSALLLNSFARMLSVDPGFDGEDVIVVDVRPPATARTHAQELLFHGALLERMARIPGVANAALMHSVPGTPGGSWSHVTVADAPPADAKQRSLAPAGGEDPGEGFVRLNPVYGDAFATLDMPVIAGSAFSDDPGEGERRVIVINEAAAREFFPDVANPVGRHLAIGNPESAPPRREIVGVVRDVNQTGARDGTAPQIYMPYGQRDIGRLTLVLETHEGVVVSADLLRRAVQDVAPGLPVDRIAPLPVRYADTAEETRFLTFLVTVFAGVGLLLAVVGTYATVTHTMLRRLREVGIRMALGAHRGVIFRGVVLRAALVAGAGLAGGIVLTLLLTRFLEAYVFGITPRDPLTLTVAAVTIGACATLAAAAPAFRATRVDPNEVLRTT